MSTRTIAIGAVTTRPPFSTLYPIDPDVTAAITDDMRIRGFDPATPIHVWPQDGALVVIDGHTRLSAASAAGLDEIVVYDHQFDSELAALGFAIHQQRDRRNLTPLELLNAIKAVDETKRQVVGANRHTSNLGGSSDPPRKSREDTARIVGTSPAMVQRARSIFDDPTGEAMKELREGASISEAATRALARKKPAGATKPSNGLTPVNTIQRHDKEDWYRVSSVGHTAETKLFVAARDIQAEIDKLVMSGIDPTQFMRNRRVTPGWNKALKEANRIAALLRSILRANES